MFTRALILSLAILGVACPPATAQNLSVGVMAGGSLTDGFKTEDTAAVRFFSTSKDYLIGPTLEWNFSPRWSIEVDGLFRELHLGVSGVAPNGIMGSTNPSPVVTWEFPILAKYRFTQGRVRPLVETGAAFRTSGNLNGTNPSHYGFTAGGGVELRSGRLTLAPVLRYTHWAEDSGNAAFQAKSNPNQVELAVGVSTAPESNMHPLGTRISVGALVGTGLTHDTRTSGFAFAAGAQSFSQFSYPRRGVIGGPALELGLPAGFAVEADAIYRPVLTSVVTRDNGMPPRNYSAALGNWDLPVLAKWKLSTPFGRPVVEGGPTFRTGSGDLSHYGVAAGLGFEMHFHAVRIVPTLRYSHWAADNNYGSSVSIRNRLDFLAAFYL